eukprot:12913539-Prorocentrum_lima.AAC.1
MTHIYEDDGTKHYGIARFPIDEWMALGEPVITVKHWVKLCMKSAAGGLTHLSRVFSICTDMEARL